MQRITVLLVLMLAACSSSAKTAAPTDGTSATSTTAGTERLGTGADYERLVAPVVAAQDVIRAVPDDAGLEEFLKATKPFAVTLKTFNRELLATEWPADVEPDIKRFVTDNGAVITTLTLLEDVGPFGLETWAQEFASNMGRSNADSDIVRAGLGLPAKP